MKDQAEKLREQMASMKRGGIKQTKVITVTSGKGGVGKSNFSLNFAITLTQHQQDVVLCDLDIGLANLDVLMGITPKRKLKDLMQEHISVWDIMEEGPDGVRFIAGGSGATHTLQDSPEQIDIFLNKINVLQGQVDYLIFDLGAGLSLESLQLMTAADEVIIVTTPEPTAITDAYAVLKMLLQKEKSMPVGVVVNRYVSTEEAKHTSSNLKMVAKQFLDHDLTLLGSLPDDSVVVQSVKQRTPFVLQYPQSAVSRAVKQLTNRYLNIPSPKTGGIARFFHKLLSVWDDQR